MKTKTFLTESRELVIENEIKNLLTFKSYQDGTRNAKDQAFKNYEQMQRIVEQKRWFKIVEQEGNHPTIIWTNNGSLTILVWKDGNVRYDEEVNGTLSVCRVIGASSNGLSFYGSITEVVEAVKKCEFKHSKSEILAPVELIK
jgi:hypothetical protein